MRCGCAVGDTADTAPHFTAVEHVPSSLVIRNERPDDHDTTATAQSCNSAATRQENVVTSASNLVPRYHSSQNGADMK